ncbi:MAG: 4-hydroxybenzoate octaprenyltransferase [Phycisphaerales bacterium]
MSAATTTLDARPRAASLFAQLRLAAADIKLAHSVFALPFAVLAAFLARAPGAPWGRFAGQLALIVACMVAARTWAMLVNRLADRAFDAANTRTAHRTFASGQLSPARGWAFAFAAASLFVGATALFLAIFDNPWPLILSVPALAWIAFYSYTKRFTPLCHLILGGALAASPVAAAVAVDPASLSAAPAVWFIAGMVLVWVAGFDVIYALQDRAFDRSAGLRSIPATLGVAGTVWVSRGLHAAAVALLVLALRSDARLGVLFAVGIGLVAALLVLEHAALVRGRREGAGLHPAFFTINGVVSCTLGALGAADLLR